MTDEQAADDWTLNNVRFITAGPPYEDAFLAGCLHKEAQMREREASGYRVFKNKSNEHYFINSQIHFVDDSELSEWGFKPSEEVNG